VGTGSGELSQGVYAVGLGFLAGYSGQHARSIAINAQGDTALATNGTDRCFIAPIRGAAGTTNLAYDAGTKEVYYNTSSRKVKQDIVPLLLDSTKVYLLEARSFVYISDVEAGPQSGYIAEEVADVDPAFASYSFDDKTPVNINWNAVQVCVVEEMKKMRVEIDALKAQLAPAAALEAPAAPADAPAAPADPADEPVAPAAPSDPADPAAPAAPSAPADPVPSSE
jgi:hypothetical protein